MNIDFHQDIGDREEQEDRYVIQSTKDGFAAHVLDGHGGKDCVECAAMCLENDVLPRFDIIQENAEIIRGLQGICTKYDKQGTTLTSMYYFGRYGHISILGDSPAWRIRDGEIKSYPVHDITNSDEIQARLDAGAKRRKSYPKHLFNAKGDGLSTFRGLGDSRWGETLGREADLIDIGEFDKLIIASDGIKIPPSMILALASSGAKAIIEANSNYLKGFERDNATVIIYSH